MRLITAILVLGVLWASPSFAQTPRNLLRGAKTLYVVLDITSTGEDKCSIKEDDIVSAYKFPFSNSNIVLSDKLVGSDLMLYINAGSMDAHIGGLVVGCAFHISFEVNSFIVDEVPFNGKQNAFLAALYTDSSMHISNVSEFRNDVRDAIEEKSKKFITAYNLDNK